MYNFVLELRYAEFRGMFLQALELVVVLDPFYRTIGATRSTLAKKCKSPTMAAAKADPRVLPKKENDLFKSIAKHYETKQYKKGIKVRPRRMTVCRRAQRTFVAASCARRVLRAFGVGRESGVKVTTRRRHRGV